MTTIKKVTDILMLAVMIGFAIYYATQHNWDAVWGFTFAFLYGLMWLLRKYQVYSITRKGISSTS